MRKLIEDLHISVNEKDAEIIKLRMHLGDERNKIQQERRHMRKTASQNSLNQSVLTSGSKQIKQQHSKTGLKRSDSEQNSQNEQAE